MNLKRILAIILLLVSCAPAVQPGLPEPLSTPAPLPASQVKLHVALMINFSTGTGIKTRFDLQNAGAEALKSLNYTVSPAKTKVRACKTPSTGWGLFNEAINEVIRLNNADKGMVLSLYVEAPNSPLVTACAAFVRRGQRYDLEVTSVVGITANARDYASLDDAMTAAAQNAVVAANTAEIQR